MRYLLATVVCVLSACGGSSDGGGITTPPKKKPDPWITVRVRDQLDTTTAAGRANWRMYSLINGVDANNKAVAYASSISIADRRAARDHFCTWAGADSVGQRTYEALAIADTTTELLHPDAEADSVAARWFRGDHSLPAGWAALSSTAMDAWQSAQYQAGHGLVSADPIKWGFDWTTGTTASFYERTDTDATCATVF